MGKAVKRSQGVCESEALFRDPLEAAQHIDSLMKVIQSRYGSTKDGSADLGNFLITRAEVSFSKQVQCVTLEKRPESQTLAILSPVVSKPQEEETRVELLNAFGELILKFQKQAYLQIRDMLLKILDEEGRRIFLDDFTKYLNDLERNNSEREE